MTSSFFPESSRELGECLGQVPSQNEFIPGAETAQPNDEQKVVDNVLQHEFG